jgi:hypothetical protein
MSQRGITGDMIELAIRFGTLDGDRIVLGRKELGRLIAEVRDIERVAMKAIDKGGVVVVEAGGNLVTTYNRDSFDRRIRQRHRARRPHGYQ